MFRKLLILNLSLLLISVLSQADTKVENGKFQIDVSHSKVGFEIPHLVISTVEGSFKVFDGEIEVANDFTKSKVSANIKVDSIDTGTKDRDDHLKSPDFFDVKKYPNIIFISKAIKGTPDSFSIEGDLTIHGEKKPITLEGKYLGAVSDAYGNRKMAITAKGKLNRKDFGLKWGKLVEAGPVIGDEVSIEFKIQATKLK